MSLKNSELLIAEMSGKQIYNKKQSRRDFIKNVVRDSVIGTSIVVGLIMGIFLSILN